MILPDTKRSMMTKGDHWGISIHYIHFVIIYIIDDYRVTVTTIFPCRLRSRSRNTFETILCPLSLSVDASNTVHESLACRPDMKYIHIHKRRRSNETIQLNRIEGREGQNEKRWNVSWLGSQIQTRLSFRLHRARQSIILDDVHCREHLNHYPTHLQSRRGTRDVLFELYEYLYVFCIDRQWSSMISITYPYNPENLLG